MKKILVLILLGLITCPTLFSYPIWTRSLGNYSDTSKYRYWDKALSKGLQYKLLYENELGTSMYLDSSLMECKKEYAKLINAPISTKHNWAITTLITVTTLIINWAVFLLINKK